MVYRVQNDIVEKILKKLPFLRYNDTKFYDVEECFFSRNGVKEIPWKSPETATVHRIVSEIDMSSANNFEKDRSAFLKAIEYFFDLNQPKTFEHAKHYLIHGTRYSNLATEVAMWPTVEKVFETVDLTEYMIYSRLIVNIPCSNLNIHIIQLAENKENLYLEITSNTGDYEGSENLIKELDLKDEVTTSFGELAAQAISAKSSSEGSN